jgi:hypothetical protein
MARAAVEHHVTQEKDTEVRPLCPGRHVKD